MIDALRPADDDAVAPRSGHAGELPGCRVYDGDCALVRETARVVDDLIARDTLGDFRTQHFTGAHSADGGTEWADGEPPIESVYRFKGPSAAGVVLTEIEFEALGKSQRHKLVVGLTRPHFAADMVLLKRAGPVAQSLLGYVAAMLS